MSINTLFSEFSECSELIRKKVGHLGLHCVVNNAGISGGYVVADMIPMSELRHVMEVNFFGQVAVTKAVSEFIIQAKRNDPRYGRIVNITSAAGTFAPPRMAAYTASKFAFEAFSDVLRREYMAWKIPVATIEPGYFQTRMVFDFKDHAERLLNNVTDEIADRWGDDYLNSDHLDLVVAISENPSKAVNALIHAIAAVKPNRHYLPGLQASLLFYPTSLMPTSVQDLLIPVLAMVTKPNRIAPDQSVHWIYRVSDVLVKNALRLIKWSGYKVVQPIHDDDRMTVRKLQLLRIESLERAAASAAGSKEQTN